MTGGFRLLRRLARRRILFATVCAVLGAGAGLATWETTKDSPQPPVRPQPESTPLVDGRDESPTPRPRSQRKQRRSKPKPRVDHRPEGGARVPAHPPRLEIPSIGVRAHAVALGTTASNKLEVPRNWSEVGWWKGGSLPGRRGVAVVAGHVDSKSGPAVFHRLSELAVGSEVRFVHESGVVARFRVVGKDRYPKDRFPTEKVYAETRAPTMRLITCGGTFDGSTGHYRDNVVVYAVRA